jgi:hypothetical protein
MQTLLPISPYAQIGSIIHALISETSAGKIENFSQFDALWDTHIQQLEHNLIKSHLTQHFVPLNKNIQNLSNKKFQCWDIVQDIKSSFSSYSYSKLPPSSERTFLSERWVQTQDGRIGGFIDAIVKDIKGNPIIIEFKTGEIFSPETSLINSEKVIRLEYLTQVYIYAALFYENRGIWPSKILITSISGDIVEVKFDQNFCLSLIEIVKKEIATTNGIIREYYNDNQTLLLHLAKPSIKACFFCLYRPICKNYWKVREMDISNDWPKDTKGIVQDVKILGNGMQLVHLKNKIHDNIVSIRGLNPLRYDLTHMEGQEIAIYNLYSEFPENSYKEGSLTTIYTYKD